VRANSDGTYLVEGNDGMLYNFNTTGALTTVQSTSDDQHPAAPRYTYNPAVDIARLQAITDPVSGRSVTLKYSGGVNGVSPCADAPTGFGFDTQGPSGMLCEIDYWDSTKTLLYYVSGNLARIQDPGPEITDFAYDANSRLTKVRDSLQADWVVVNPTVRDTDGARTLISYDISGRATQVQLA
jgi:YD repeat-containing protein